MMSLKLFVARTSTARSTMVANVSPLLVIFRKLHEIDPWNAIRKFAPSPPPPPVGSLFVLCYHSVKLQLTDARSAPVSKTLQLKTKVHCSSR